MRIHLLPFIVLAPLGAQIPDASFFLGPPEKVALFCLEKALARKPKSVEILASFGELQLALGDRKKADEWFSRAERLEANDAETYRLIAQACLRADIRDQVPALAGKAKDRAPGDTGDLADFAIVLLDSGFPAEARALMDQALKAGPRRSGNFIEFGAALLRAGCPDEAGTWFDRALAVNSTKVGTHKDIALAYADHARKADLPGVKARMLAAAEIGFYGTDADNEAMADHARVHLAAGQRAEAEALFLRIMTSKKVHAGEYRLIGQAWLRAGCAAEAFRAYEVLPSAQGKGGSIGFGAPIAMTGGSPGMGVGVAVTVNLGELDRKRALSYAAMDLVAAGYFDKALPLMEEVFFTAAGDQNELAKFGRMALEASHREEAARFFQKAIQVDPRDWETWQAIGQAYADAITRQPPAAVAAIPQG